ncbi:50S ribosomal protein L18e [Candidatus Woesearchaeota archaeon]|nr:50S ribosomal protein L18e [Candidatus Woesearchaeota archaeon]
MVRTGPTNPLLRGLIQELKEKSREQEAPLWKAVAVDLERPSRNRRVVNLSRISRSTKANEFVVVPGKVLGSGDLTHKVTIAAYQFSDGAQEKITQAGGKAISLKELIKTTPQGKGIRVIG